MLKPRSPASTFECVEAAANPLRCPAVELCSAGIASQSTTQPTINKLAQYGDTAQASITQQHSTKYRLFRSLKTALASITHLSSDSCMPSRTHSLCTSVPRTGFEDGTHGFCALMLNS